MWIGDDPSQLTAHMFVDANFAGCPYSLKSTNGCHFDIQGPNSRFTISASCAAQTAVAQSSTESEIAFLNAGMKNRAEPALRMLSLILGRYHEVEDAACGGDSISQENSLTDDPARIDEHFHSKDAASGMGSGGKSFKEEYAKQEKTKQHYQIPKG